MIVAIILAASHSQGKTIHCTRRFKDTLGWGGWGTKYSKCKYLTSNIIAILPKSRFIHSRTPQQQMKHALRFREKHTRRHFSKLFILNLMIFCFTSCADAVDLYDSPLDGFMEVLRIEKTHSYQTKLWELQQNWPLLN